MEHPPVGGPALRIENSIKALSRVSDLYIVSRVSHVSLGGVQAEDFYKKFCKAFFYAPSARVSANKYIRRFQREWHKVFGVAADTEFILRKVDEHNIDVLWCGYGCVSYPLVDRIKTLRPGLKVVCDTDSVWSRFVLRELPFERDPRRRAEIEKQGRAAEAWERKMIRMCEIMIAVSEVDAEYYRSITAEPERVMMFSNVIDLKTYEGAPRAVAAFKKPCIYLAGTFGHENSPMDRAARWMIEEVLPMVKKEIPQVHFYLVGRDSEIVWGNLEDPSITVTGKVPSVLPYLCHADVAVVPLQFESGTRFKIIEAGACKVPIVSTALGAEGIPVVHERDILLADTPQDFAGAIIRVMKDKDLAARLGSNCQKLIWEKYSVEYLAVEARAILQRLEGR